MPASYSRQEQLFPCNQSLFARAALTSPRRPSPIHPRPAALCAHRSRPIPRDPSATASRHRWLETAPHLCYTSSSMPPRRGAHELARASTASQHDKNTHAPDIKPGGPMPCRSPVDRSILYTGAGPTGPRALGASPEPAREALAPKPTRPALGGDGSRQRRRRCWWQRRRLTAS